MEEEGPADELRGVRPVRDGLTDDGGFGWEGGLVLMEVDGFELEGGLSLADDEEDVGRLGGRFEEVRVLLNFRGSSILL